MKRALYSLIIFVLLVCPAHGDGHDAVLTDHVGKNIVVLEISGAEVSSWEMAALVPIEAGDAFSPEN